MSVVMASPIVLPVAVVAVLATILLPVASADWKGDATVGTSTVTVNFTEKLSVKVTNTGTGPLEVMSVSVTINWDGMPTLYHVFDGDAVLAAGETREFISPATRMPNAAPGHYSCFASVTAKGEDGAAVQHRYPDTIVANTFNISLWGVPEWLLVPLAFTASMLLLTAAMFRWERVPGWPPFRARPRWERRSAIPPDQRID